MELHTINGTLHPHPPFDFSKSLDFASYFVPAECEQTISGISFTKAIYLKGQTVAFKLMDRGTIENPVLSYTLYSSPMLSEEIKTELLDRISFYLSLDDDLKQFYKLGRRDAEFKSVIDIHYGLHQVKFLTPFEAAIWAVLSQKLSMKAAYLLKNRLIQASGDHILVDGVDHWTFPDAAQVKSMGLEKLKSLLKNKRKSEYLMAVAQAFDQVDEHFLREGDIGDVKDWLMNIKGIGEFSAHLELIRGLGRMEELPEHDRMLFKCSKKVYGPDITDDELKKIADRYGEFKGYWAYYIRATCY